MRRYLVLDAGPNFVAVNKGERKLAPFWPGAKEEAAFMTHGIGRSLGVGVFREVGAEIVFVDGQEVALDPGRVDEIREAAHSADPGAQYAVAEATRAVLVLWPFLFDKRHGFLRILTSVRLRPGGVGCVETFVFDLLEKILAIVEGGLHV